MRIAEITLRIILILLLLAPLPYSTPRPMSLQERVVFLTDEYHFDYTGWSLDALWVKVTQGALGTPSYFTGASQRQVVIQYMNIVDQIEQIDHEISLIYADPAIKDPDTASAAKRRQWIDLTRRQNELAPFAESVLERQVSEILNEIGLTTGGQPIPWVMYHVSPLPQNLVLSRREVIGQISSVLLLPDLSVEQMERIENQVGGGMNVSTLVVPVGGIALYPTMIMRTTALDWLANTIAHEWIHVYLGQRPLGSHYDASPELHTMNETTASIAGDEIGRIVIQRYYPELAHLLRPPLQTIARKPQRQAADFDFNAEMHTTRVTADQLLAEGKIDEAEAYMEQRRIFFWDNGYLIRKLNQAYFAFYGAYADQPGGAAGEDPVGPAVRALRAQSATLTEFLERIAQMSTFEELIRAVKTNSESQAMP